MTDPFQVLEQEHRLISRVLDALAKAVEQDMPLDYYERAVTFIEGYATVFHHAKEEHILYRYLLEHGMPRDYGPLGVVLEEHDYGDEHIANMRKQLAAEDRAGLIETVKVYVTLLRQHVATEDDLLLPMGRAMLTEEEIAEVAARFDALPDPDPSVEHWTAVAERLETEVEVPA